MKTKLTVILLLVSLVTSCKGLQANELLQLAEGCGGNSFLKAVTLPLSNYLGVSVASGPEGIIEEGILKPLLYGYTFASKVGKDFNAMESILRSSNLANFKIVETLDVYATGVQFPAYGNLMYEDLLSLVEAGVEKIVERIQFSDYESERTLLTLTLLKTLLGFPHWITGYQKTFRILGTDADGAADPSAGLYLVLKILHGIIVKSPLANQFFRDIYLSSEMLENADDREVYKTLMMDITNRLKSSIALMRDYTGSFKSEFLIESVLLYADIVELLGTKNATSISRIRDNPQYWLERISSKKAAEPGYFLSTGTNNFKEKY